MPVSVTVWVSVYLTKLIDCICTRIVCQAPCDKARARLLLVQSNFFSTHTKGTGEKVRMISFNSYSCTRRDSLDQHKQKRGMNKSQHTIVNKREKNGFKCNNLRDALAGYRCKTLDITAKKSQWKRGRWRLKTLWRIAEFYLKHILRKTNLPSPSK